MKINVLDSSIYNLISAGEVVERPASVVKELVENSIDAGAKSVKIEVFSGGKSKIRVTDDGAGIAKDDLLTAFLPHATSKIHKKDDLFSIQTLGFRGEALASIAAVSMVNVISKTDADDAAYGAELRGGKVENTFECAGVTGTSISVENLFFLTPARLKFLKKDKSEESEITSLILKMILANPYIAFSYYADDKNIFKTDGTGLKNAINSVYNREITMNFIEIENTFGGFSIKGFISKPTYFKGNRSCQTTIINGRVIENKTISTAVEKAYEPFLMKRSYPLYVIEINMPFDKLDVNVHPSKADVRFQDNHQIFSFVYSSVQRTLMSYDDVKSVPQLEYADADGEIMSETAKKGDYNNENAAFFSDFTKNHDENKLISDDNISFSNENLSGFLKKDGNFSGFNQTRAADGAGDAFYRIIKNKMATENAKTENVQQSFDNIDFDVKSDNAFDFDGKVIGQVFATYLLVEKDENLYIIDQHAAHERILYDKLTKNGSEYAQPLLIPYIYYASAQEFDFITEIIPTLSNIGFDIEKFSNDSFKVSAVPEALTDINFDEFFKDITRDFVRVNLSEKDLLKEKLMQRACKSAIKGGDVLNNAQIGALLKSFKDSENKPLQCPHGRPTVIKFSKTDFEKWFKRIV